MDDEDFDPYLGAADDASVGSLAYVAAPTSSAPSSFKNRSKKSGGGGTSDDDSQDSTSPENIVRKKVRGVLCYKRLVLLLIVVGGAYLSTATHRQTLPEDVTKSTAIVAFIFIAILAAFWRYDVLISRRNFVVMDIAKRSRSIVNQLFPGGFRDRLLNQDQSTERRGSKTESGTAGADDPYPITDFAKLTKINTLANQKTSSELANASGKTSTVKSFLKANGDKKLIAQVVQNNLKDEPMAELFPNTTVLFADIAGFTAWSSERDPAAVFTLLETAYATFDDMAEKLKVFKVETIGDCYMCVTGLPEPDENHAVNMARFAYQIVSKMDSICQDLEEKLGPGTEELAMRVGCHSGPVTAGVLRNQKSRFQLFGDTVNTASRMESTGRKGCIQVSEETALLLIAAGKGHWVQERPDRVQAKGKGTLRTFWLDPRKRRVGTASSDDDQGIVLSNLKCRREQAREPIMSRQKKMTRSSQSLLTATTAGNDPIISKQSTTMTEDRRKRLIDWTTNVLLRYLVNIYKCQEPAESSSKSIKLVDHTSESSELPPIFDSVTESLPIPKYDPYKVKRRHDELPAGKLDNLRDQVYAYVYEIASLYNTCHFHGFEHASHVTLAMDKLVTRLSSAEVSDREMHEMTFGLSSDPITHFALVFAAFVHDVGHPGVTNAQLIAEGHHLAHKFYGKSMIEQNSLELAWNILMKPCYIPLRKHIYRTNAERKRFRQVLVNAVMATDISDRSLLQLRARRWQRAFDIVESEDESPDVGKRRELRETTNRKATAVVDALMQLADIAHTLQHWNIYRKWNDKLFQEVMSAYLHGRASFDPEKIWYRGELAFFDHFVIPLARRLQECGIFGCASSQYLSFAIANRKQWEERGQEILDALVVTCRQTRDMESCDNDEMENIVKMAMGQVSKEMSIEKSIVDLVLGQLVAQEISHHSEKERSMPYVDSNSPAMEVVREDPSITGDTDMIGAVSIDSVGTGVNSTSSENRRQDIQGLSSANTFVSQRLDV